MKKKIKKTKKTKVTEREDAHDDPEPTTDSPKRGRPAGVNYDEFVKVWCGSESLTEVAETMGIKRNSASAIASRLRKAGVTALRNFPRRGAQPIDAKRLNKIAAGKKS